MHECGTSRAIGYFLEPLLLLGLWGKKVRGLGRQLGRADPFDNQIIARALAAAAAVDSITNKVLLPLLAQVLIAYLF